jgi:dTDP-glucose 4,6-dehydratase
VERLLVTSTSEVYGTARYVPIDEAHPLQGQSPYSATKIGADKLAEAYHASFSLPVVVVRPFNTYGPRQSGRAVVPTIIGQALAGGEIRIGSLDPVRDLTYVEDTVEGFLALSSAQGIDGRVVNLGCGSSISIGELARRICAIYGREDAEVVVDPERVRPERSEVMELRSDNRLARELAGWEPRISLDEGLRRTVEWFEKVAMRDPGRYRR